MKDTEYNKKGASYLGGTASTSKKDLGGYSKKDIDCNQVNGIISW